MTAKKKSNDGKNIRPVIDFLRLKGAYSEKDLEAAIDLKIGTFTAADKAGWTSISPGSRNVTGARVRTIRSDWFCAPLQGGSAWNFLSGTGRTG